MSIDPTSFFASLFGDTTLVTVFIWLTFAILIIVVLAKAWPVIKRFVHTMDALSELPDALKKIDTITEELKVLEELRPNHGGSIRDQVMKTGKQVAQTDKKLSEHIAMCKIVEDLGFDDE